jgi:hypothetical protein
MNTIVFSKNLKIRIFKLFFLWVLQCWICNITSAQAISYQDSLQALASKAKQANIKAAAKSHFQHFVLKNEDGTFGYAIFINGNMTYHQPNIPAVSGAKGFTKLEHAEAVAKMAIQKIRKGESPPTLSVEEVERIISKSKLK